MFITTAQGFNVSGTLAYAVKQAAYFSETVCIENALTTGLLKEFLFKCLNLPNSCIRLTMLEYFINVRS